MSSQVFLCMARPPPHPAYCHHPPPPPLTATQLLIFVQHYSLLSFHDLLLTLLQQSTAEHSTSVAQTDMCMRHFENTMVSSFCDLVERIFSIGSKLQVYFHGFS